MSLDISITGSAPGSSATIYTKSEFCPAIVPKSLRLSNAFLPGHPKIATIRLSGYSSLVEENNFSKLSLLCA